jgi:N-acetylneuraminic acid mutarotase
MCTIWKFRLVGSGLSLIVLAASCTSLAAQNAEWTWVSGNSPGVYGTLGVPSTENIPGPRPGATYWRDQHGNFWLFGGGGLNDLWKFNTDSLEWTWVSGSSDSGSGGVPGGVCGSLGIFAPENVPQGRAGAIEWTDSTGKFWIFGGSSFFGDWYILMNDLWQFDPSIHQWAWMNGSCAGDPRGVYGTFGVASPSNLPPGRREATSWIDQSGNLWLFGGVGWIGSYIVRHPTEPVDVLNDLWQFNPTSQEWTWMGGSAQGRQPGIYGCNCLASPPSVPGSRQSATGWVDQSGNLWLFGGSGVDSAGVYGPLDDVWQFNPLSNQWGWMGGDSTVGDSGARPAVYGTIGIPSPENTPGGRDSAAGWSDTKGKFWLFGGEQATTAGGATQLGDLFGDLWELDPATAEWTWIAGSSTPNQVPIYGTQGVPSPGNLPGSRSSLSGWVDELDRVWIFGGFVFNNSVTPGALNDLWVYGAFQPIASSPVFALPAGTYPAGQQVTISDSTQGATIRYSTDGSVPTKDSMLYSAPISLNQTTTIKAIAFAPGYIDSPVSTATYTIQTSVGSFSLKSPPVSVPKGSPGTTSVTVSTDDQYVGIVTLFCSVTSSPVGAVDLPTCSASQTVTLSSRAATGTATLTMRTTPARSASFAAPARQNFKPFHASGGMVLACLFLVIGLGRRNARKLLLLVMSIAIFTIGFGSCGGGGGSTPIKSDPGTTPGAYTITVTGTGSDTAKTTASITFMLTVQ